MTSLAPDQRSIVRTAWLTYAGYYLGRVNLSPAIPALVIAFSVTRAEIGVVATALFWTYSVGQYLSGELGNRLNARKLVAIGLVISACCNLGMAFQTTVGGMVLLWGVNGVAQSVGWSPILRVLADHLEVDQRRRVSAWFPMSYQVGIAVTWAITGFVVALFGWQAAFVLPSLLLCGVLAMWWLSGVDALPAKRNTSQIAWRESLREARFLLPVTLASVCIGFASSGAVIWLPTYIKDTALFPDALVGAFAGVLPLIGILGIFVASWLTRQFEQITHSVMLMLGMTVMVLVVATMLPVQPQLIALTVAIILISGATGVTLSAIPMMTAWAGRTSSVAGTLSAANSLGGGLAGVVVGAIVQQGGWSAVFGAWGVGLFIAMGLIYVYGRALAAAPAS